jgi:hypothetical protein
MRLEVLKTLDKFGCILTSEYVINILHSNLNSESPELKLNLLKWFLKNEEGLAKCEFKQMVPNLIGCLIDKSKDVRILAEHVVLIGVKVLGLEAFKQ